MHLLTDNGNRYSYSVRLFYRNRKTKKAANDTECVPCLFCCRLRLQHIVFCSIRKVKECKNITETVSQNKTGELTGFVFWECRSQLMVFVSCVQRENSPKPLISRNTRFHGIPEGSQIGLLHGSSLELLSWIALQRKNKAKPSAQGKRKIL